MDHTEIARFLGTFKGREGRTIVVVDFGNVDKWQMNLNWKVGLQELARLIKNFSKGSAALRRFYYGSDYGPNDRSVTQTLWSHEILARANGNGFTVVDKRVKYIHDAGTGKFNKKCDLDVEMTVDLIRLRDLYDQIILFSGDGDLAYALKYLKQEYGKSSYVFGARNHIGREIVDAVAEGIIDRLLYVEDFEYRLNMNRFRYR